MQKGRPGAMNKGTSWMWSEDRSTGSAEIRPAQYCHAVRFFGAGKCGLYGYTNELWAIWRDMLKYNLTTCGEDAIMNRSERSRLK